MHIENEHIRAWIQAGTALIVSTEIAARFGEYLNSLPWLSSGSGLDWSDIKGREMNLSSLTEAQQIEWLRNTRIGKKSHLVFWYAGNEPCIACPFEFAASNIDQAFWKAPGKRYLFSASAGDGIIKPDFTNFAEYDGGDIIRAIE